jgi:hypothetical protein
MVDRQETAMWVATVPPTFAPRAIRRAGVLVVELERAQTAEITTKVPPFPPWGGLALVVQEFRRPSVGQQLSTVVVVAAAAMLASICAPLEVPVSAEPEASVSKTATTDLPTLVVVVAAADITTMPPEMKTVLVVTEDLESSSSATPWAFPRHSPTIQNRLATRQFPLPHPTLLRE